MYEIEECMSRYQRLLRLLEEDSDEIEQGIRGRLLDAYRDLLTREKEALKNALKTMYNAY